MEETKSVSKQVSKKTSTSTSSSAVTPDQSKNKKLMLVIGCTITSALVVCCLCGLIGLQLINSTRRFEPGPLTLDINPETFDGQNDADSDNDVDKETNSQNLKREEIVLEQELVDEEVVYSLEYDQNNETLNKNAATNLNLSGGVKVTGDAFTLTIERFYEAEVHSYTNPQLVETAGGFGDVYRVKRTNSNNNHYDYVNKLGMNSKCSYLGAMFDPPCGTEGILAHDDLLFITCESASSSGIDRCDAIVSSLRFVRRADVVSEQKYRETFELSGPLVSGTETYSIEVDPEKESFDDTYSNMYEANVITIGGQHHTLTIRRFYESEVNKYTGTPHFLRNQFMELHRVFDHEAQGVTSWKYVTNLKTTGTCQYLGNTFVAPCGDEFASTDEDLLVIECATTTGRSSAVNECDRLVSTMRSQKN